MHWNEFKIRRKINKKKFNSRSNRRIGASSNLFRVNNFRARSLVNGARKRALSPPQKWVATNRCGGVEHRVFSPRRISLKTRLVESSTRRENPREEPLPSSLSPSPPRGTKSGSLVNARGNAKRAKSCAPRGGGGGGRERHDPFLQTSKFLPTNYHASCLPLSPFPSLLSQPDTRY